MKINTLTILDYFGGGGGYISEGNKLDDGILLCRDGTIESNRRHCYNELNRFKITIIKRDIPEWKSLNLKN